MRSHHLESHQAPVTMAEGKISMEHHILDLKACLDVASITFTHIFLTKTNHLATCTL